MLVQKWEDGRERIEVVERELKGPHFSLMPIGSLDS
jgi:hypothetical protein